MNTLNFSHCCLLALLLFSACRQEQPTTLEAFYFPMDALKEGLVYEYVGVDPMDPPFYWYYRTEEREEGNFLVSMYYDHTFMPYQLVTEERVDNGMLLTRFYLYEMDSLTQMQTQAQVEIESGNLFPFEAEAGKTVLFYQVNWTMPSDTTVKTTLVRNRQFMGDTTYTYQGKTYEAIHFYTRELIDIEQKGHFEYEFEGMEIYARGIGLVYFRKDITDEFRTEYRLSDRYPMTQLEEKFSAYYGKTRKTIPIPQ